MECRYQPGPGLREFRPGQTTAGQTCSRKDPAVTISIITPPRHEVPAHSDPVKYWNFRKADWKRFCLPAGESVERLPLPGTSNIERAHQDFARAYHPQPNNVSTWPSEDLYAMLGQRVRGTLSEPQWRLTLIEPLRPYYLGYNRNRSKPSTSRTLAARTINKLTGRSGCSFQLCRVSANSVASQLVKNGAHKTMDRKSNRLINKQLSDLWKIPWPEGHSKSETFRPEELASAQDWIPSLRSLYSTPGQLSNLSFCDFLSSCMSQSKFQRSGEEH